MGRGLDNDFLQQRIYDSLLIDLSDECNLLVDYYWMYYWCL